MTTMDDRARSIGRAGTAVAVLALVFSAVAVGIWRLAGDGAAVRHDPRGIFSKPLGGGTEVPLTQAVATFPLPVYRPNMDLASDDTLHQVWVRLDDPEEAYLIYDSGVEVTVFTRDTFDTEAYASAQVSEGVPGTLVDLDGVTAFEAPQNAPWDKGSVTFVLGHALVTVIGDIPMSSLDRVARSIIATAVQVGAEHAAAS